MLKTFALMRFVAMIDERIAEEEAGSECQQPAMGSLSHTNHTQNLRDQ